MKPNYQKVRKKRHFSEDFKRSLVRDYERGKFSVLELESMYHIGNSNIYKWIYKYSTFNEKSVQVVEMKESSTKKLKEKDIRIKELERIVGLKQLQIDYLEKMMEVAKEELGVDIKKNFNTPQSAGSGKTKTP